MITLGETGNRYRIESRDINITDTSNFTDVLTVGLRGTFKITISGADASDGALAEHISESWLVASNTVGRQATINTVLNTASAGLDVKWKDTTDTTSEDYRTIQVKPQNIAANQYTVTVETFSRFISNQATVTWI